MMHIVITPLGKMPNKGIIAFGFPSEGDYRITVGTQINALFVKSVKKLTKEGFSSLASHPK